MFPQRSLTQIIAFGVGIGALAMTMALVVVASATDSSAGSGPAGGSAEWVAPRVLDPDGSAPAGDWRRSIVLIRTNRCHGQIAGTGVVIDGAVVTNRHVIDGAASAEIVASDGSRHSVTSASVSSRIDLAVLEANGLRGGLSLASEPLSVPTSATAALEMGGYPAGYEYDSRRVSVDSVLEGHGFPDPRRALKLDTRVIGGESGSPLIDADHRVAGLLYAAAITDHSGLVIDATDIRSELGFLAPLGFAECRT